MSKTFCFGVVALPLMISLISDPAMAQGTAPPEQTQTPPATAPPQPGQPAQPGQPEQPSQGANPPLSAISPTTTVEPSKPAPPKEPYVLPDGGFSFEPFYWLANGQPRLRGGLQALNIGDLSYAGKAKPALGGEIGIPAGRSNTLRISYFRVQGNSNSTLPNDALIFGESYLAGDFINASYKVQAIKASWDYLSYTWHKSRATIRVKTLWEAQYVNTSFVTSAPTTISATAGDTLMSTGTKSVILPTFGMALGGEMGRFFRWEVRGSGFGLPQRATIGDLQGVIALRVSKVEVIAGERFYHFKTSPKTDMYTNETLQGVFGGLRFVWAGKL